MFLTKHLIYVLCGMSHPVGYSMNEFSIKNHPKLAEIWLKAPCTYHKATNLCVLCWLHR